MDTQVFKMAESFRDFLINHQRSRERIRRRERNYSKAREAANIMREEGRISPEKSRVLLHKSGMTPLEFENYIAQRNMPTIKELDTNVPEANEKYSRSLIGIEIGKTVEITHKSGRKARWRVLNKEKKWGIDGYFVTFKFIEFLEEIRQ